ncbi:MAG: CocE/NonD family hydrolase [Solirubrobacteraceae bacterium]
MSYASEILARRMRLPRAQTEDVVSDHNLPAVMDDGVVLLADRWVARDTRATPQPTVLVRSPYGRRQLVGLMLGRLLAERGLQVVIQSVRGTFGSEGDFSPFDERADGLATLRWLREQPWHSDRIGMIGPSYLGLVQWAVAPEAGDDLAALSIHVSASQFHGQTYAGGSLSLETAASWLVLVGAQERRLAPVAIARALRRLPTLFSELPITDLDERATGAEVAWFREALANPRREDAYWITRDFAQGVGRVTAPVQLVGGWHDIFLPWMLEDFRALQVAGRQPQLTIGPWTHTAPGLLAEGMREGLAWLRARLLLDDRLVREAPVRVFVSGEGDEGGEGGEGGGEGSEGSEGGKGGWRDLPTWPPPGTGERRLWLGSEQRLREQEPAVDEWGDRYTYDPSDPTPSVGGAVLLTLEPVLDNRSLEDRSDVLTYTTEPLSSGVEAIGPTRVELWVRATSPHFDMFARVCDVDSNDVSWNVCDALARVTRERFEQLDDGAFQVAFDLWPIGHMFASGHRIRLQLSSGAHPRFARNPGTGEDAASATELRAVELEVLHDAQHPSVLILPRKAARLQAP